MKTHAWNLIACVAWCLALAACERDPVLIRTSSRFAIDASVACGANAFQIGGTPAAPVCACLPGFFGNGFVCTEEDPLCGVGGDADTGTASFAISHLGIPADGFNLDGPNNAPPPAGVGSNVAGCGKVDIPGGIDNALVGWANGVDGTIDVAASLEASLAHARPDGGTPGPIGLFVALSHLASANAPNDPCVSVDFVVTRAEQPIRSFHGQGTLIENVLFTVFEAGVALPFVPEMLPEACNGSTCVPTVLEFPIEGARARLVLDPTHTRLIPGSILAGFMFFHDCTGSSSTGCTDGPFAAANASGLEAVVSAWALAANLTPESESQMVQSLAGARDMHMNVDGTVSPCTGANTSVTNKNSVSAAFAIESE